MRGKGVFKRVAAACGCEYEYMRPQGWSIALNSLSHLDTTSVPKYHIQISMVWYLPMIRRYLSHSWVPRSAVLAHDTKISAHYMGAQELHLQCNSCTAEPLNLFGRP